MIKSFDEILAKVKEKKIKKVAVAVAQDESVLQAIKEVNENGIADAILVGDKDKITEIAMKIDFNLTKIEIMHEPNDAKATLKAVELVSQGKADALMKGLIDTATFLSAVLNKEVGLRTGKFMSHVAVFEIPNFERMIFLTDVAFNKYPDINAKVDIINNSVEVAHILGVECPNVAAISCIEGVNSDMPSTMDAALLAKMSDRGQIKGCIVDGPLALDNAISEEAAKHKKISGSVAGKADVFLLPNIEVGNVMYKTLEYTTKWKNGCILVGASAPVILTSRSDSVETKKNSIILSIFVEAQRVSF